MKYPENPSKKKRPVLLVYPGRPNSFFPELPMPLLYLGWALKKIGYEVEILDTRLKDIRNIRNDDYLFVGISSLTGSMIRQGINVARHVKSICRTIPIVWGGVHVSLMPEQSLQNPYVDIVVRGEGELTIQELADTLLNNGNLAGVKGISYKVDGKVHTTPNRDFMVLDDIDVELPYELFDMKKYHFGYFPVHTSRGCPYRCGFCYNIAFNRRRWRYKKAGRVLDEIEYLVRKFKCEAIDFGWEDEFFINPKRVREICKGILIRGFKIKWSSFCRFDNFEKIDDETLLIMEKSGCRHLNFGAESGSRRILDEVIQKDITIEQIVKATERLRSSNITQGVSFISGFPTETAADLEKSFELIDRLKCINPDKLTINGIYLYTPYPGTPLFDLITRKYGFKSPGSLEEWTSYGIYRDVGIFWHSKSYINKCSVLSIISRFPFYKEKFSFDDVAGISDARYTRFPFNIAYFVYANLAILRWKYKFFTFPVEFTLLEKILDKSRGFV